MRRIILYGLVLGLLLLLLQYAQYRFILIRHAESIYTGIVAAICCGVGIWAGLVYNQRRQQQAVSTNVLNEPLQSHVKTPDFRLLERLNISPREYEVLQLMEQGLSNQEIADRLYVSPNTVKTHVSNVFSKLDVQRRTQAIQRAKELGVL